MLSKKVLHYVDDMLRDICSINKPFGGKVVILGGDWKQLTPVADENSREAQTAESIKLDSLFRDNFEKLRYSQLCLSIFLIFFPV